MKNKKTYIFFAIIVIFIIYQFYNISYYKIDEPLFLKNHSYISTNAKKMPLRLYYFTNKNSDFKFVDVISINNDNLNIVFKGESINRYSKYHDRHQIHLELVGLKPGEVNISKLTFIKDDGTKKRMNSGNILYNFRDKSKKINTVNQRATGSSNANKDFSIYKANKLLIFKGIYYKLSKMNSDILKVVKEDKSYRSNINTSDLESENSLNNIFKLNLKNKKYIQNIKVNIKLNENDNLTLISFYDFENNKELKKAININIKAEVIFANKGGDKIIEEFNSEYIPYLDKDDIKKLNENN